ncbi:hypothetical protein LCGC14_1272210 [marine sediment metagenome]|uniref:Uncharacterized protein n=1 Tax=marine sediment metagenome TaxID=412755 RepID=A0A0F9KZJ6_9ZZZZ
MILSVKSEWGINNTDQWNFNNTEEWIEVTVSEADNSSYGYGELEIFRIKTCLLPGESL